jgi:hypothetical protein
MEIILCVSLSPFDHQALDGLPLRNALNQRACRVSELGKYSEVRANAWLKWSSLWFNLSLTTQAPSLQCGVSDRFCTFSSSIEPNTLANEDTCRSPHSIANRVWSPYRRRYLFGSSDRQVSSARGSVQWVAERGFPIVDETTAIARCGGQLGVIKQTTMQPTPIESITASHIACPVCKFPAPGCEIYDRMLAIGWTKVICQCSANLVNQKPCTPKPPNS